MLKVLLLFPIITSKLLFVLEHFRHGARGPCDDLDKNGNDYLGIHWDTLGELHPIGMRMHYLLGYRNKLKYKNFLQENYDPREIYIISTDLNRTITSALSHMHGMYNKGPILKDNQLNNAIPPIKLSNETKTEIENLGNFALPNQIQTIPIHIFNIIDHFFLLHEVESTSDCKPIKKIRDEISSKEFFVNYANNFNKSFGEGLLKFLKRENEKNLIANFSYIHFFCDHYISDITTLQDMNRINEMENYGINLVQLKDSCNDALEKQLFDVVFGDEKVVRMSQSPSMRQLFNYMEGRIKLNKNNNSDVLDYNYPKFVIYSAHDTSMVGVEKLMNLVFGSKLINPTYAANLYFELHFDNGKYMVKYIINDDVISEIEYNEFRNKIEKYLWSEKQIEDFCQFAYRKLKDGGPYSTYENILLTFIIILGIIIFCLGVGIIYLKCNIKKHKNKNKGFDFVETN